MHFKCSQRIRIDFYVSFRGIRIEIHTYRLCALNIFFPIFLAHTILRGFWSPKQKYASRGQIRRMWWSVLPSVICDQWGDGGVWAGESSLEQHFVLRGAVFSAIRRRIGQVECGKVQRMSSCSSPDGLCVLHIANPKKNGGRHLSGLLRRTFFGSNPLFRPRRIPAGPTFRRRSRNDAKSFGLGLLFGMSKWAIHRVDSNLLKCLPSQQSRAPSKSQMKSSTDIPLFPFF